MLRSFDDTEDTRLHTIAWLKEHLSEFDDSDMILDLRKPPKSDIMKAFDSAPTDEELDRLEETELSAAKQYHNKYIVLSISKSTLDS